MVARAVALAAALLVLGSASADARRAERDQLPACRLAQLTIAAGRELSPATGQNPLALRLTNRGRTGCILLGYPTIFLADGRGVIPFLIRRGGDQMVTASSPKRVRVGPGASAFVVINKFRCDRGSLRVARKLELGLRLDPSRRLAIALPAYPRIGYCGSGDPGSSVSTSPFVPTVVAGLRR